MHEKVRKNILRESQTMNKGALLFSEAKVVSERSQLESTNDVFLC